MRSRVEERFPRAKWFYYDAAGADSAIEGSTIAFGKPMRESLRVENADVIVTLDRDLLLHDDGGNALANARGFGAAAGRLRRGRHEPALRRGVGVDGHRLKPTTA